MGHALRYRDESELPESIRKRLQKRFAEPAPKPRVAKRGPSRRDEEHNEQVVLFNRINALAANQPKYALAAARTYAVPNGGPSKGANGRRKAEGVKKGVSDVFVSFPIHGRHGCYIEMKAQGGRVSDEQKLWIKQSIALGYVAVVCWDADEAFATWKQYVDGWAVLNYGGEAA